MRLEYCIYFTILFAAFSNCLNGENSKVRWLAVWVTSWRIDWYNSTMHVSNSSPPILLSRQVEYVFV